MLKIITRALIWTTVVLLFAVRCASISPPTGGPRDSIPPRIVRTSPAPYSVNFKGRRIVLEFNEFVKLKDQQKLFFVSPPGRRKPSLTIKNRSIVVQFENDLDSSTTYRLDFGNSIVDNNEGNAMQGFAFVFSTGDAIDSLMMAGQVIDAFTRDTIVDAFVFFFDARQDNAELDSTMFNGRASALFRTDSSGYFIADILRNKDYRAYALSDKNGNQLYEPGEDMIAFVDTTFNPTLLPGFALIYDSVKRRSNLEGRQVLFEVFKEIPVRRQMLMKAERPMRHKLLFTFNSTDAVIDTVEIAGMDSTWLIAQPNRTGDSLVYWINPPSMAAMDALGDTVRGRVVYQRHDSVWNYYPFSYKFSLVFKKPVDAKTEKKLQKAKKVKKTRAQRRAERQALRLARKKMRLGIDPNVPSTEILPPLDSLKPIPDQILPPGPPLDTLRVPTDTLPRFAEPIGMPAVNPFKFTVNAKAEMNPLDNIVFTFDYPVLEIDTARIELIRSVAIEQGGAREQYDRSRNQAQTIERQEPAPFTFGPLPDDPRRWMLTSDWKIGDKYSLMIPAGAIRNIAFETNDTLSSRFTVASPDKYGTLIIESKKDSTLTASYIFELLQGTGKQSKVVKRITGVRAGEPQTIYYVSPGDYRLRIIEDSNHNGIWDTGALTLRRQPEKVRIWQQGENSNGTRIIVKENWELPLPVDLKRIFSEP